MEQIQQYQVHQVKVRGLFSKTLLVCAIFFGIQAMNQVLIFSGSALERALTLSAPKFIVGSFQQAVQAFLGIILYYWIFKQGIRELGIHTQNFKADIKVFWLFAKIWLGVIILYLVMVYLLFPQTWFSMRAIPLPPKGSMISTIAFQSFLPGFGEEILFRGLIINLLANLVFTGYQNNTWQKVGIVILSSLYFATAHIYFSLTPFEITHFDLTQFVMALGCGAFYAVVYLKTKSLIAPFLAHNFSNVTSTIAGYLISSF